MNSEPIPHWPGEFVSLGDYQVYVRRVPPISDITRSDNPKIAAGGDGGSGEAKPDREPVDRKPVDQQSADQQSVDRKPADREPAHEQPVDREPVLCVHGLAGSSRNWTDLMNELGPRLDCAALDLPGYGDSPPRPDGRYSISALAQTVATLIERDGRGPVHLIGNSFGGAVCVKVAAKRPALIRSLTLVSPALPDLWPRMDLVRFPVISLPRVGGWALSKFKTLSPERRVANVMATCYHDPALAHPVRFAAEVAALEHRDTLSYADDAVIGSARALVVESLRVGELAPWRDAARVNVPTLVIYGSHDRLVSPRMAGRAARTFRGSRVVVLPRTGHVAMMEHPAAVAAEITVLLDGAPADLTAGPDGPARGTLVAEPAREFPLTPAG